MPQERRRGDSTTPVSYFVQCYERESVAHHLYLSLPLSFYLTQLRSRHRASRPRRIGEEIYFTANKLESKERIPRVTWAPAARYWRPLSLVLSTLENLIADILRIPDGSFFSAPATHLHPFGRETREPLTSSRFCSLSPSFSLPSFFLLLFRSINTPPLIAY